MKKVHSLKVENDILFGRQNWALNAWKTDSQIAGSEGLFWRDKRGARMYSFCWKTNKHIVEHRKITAHHKTRHFNVIILMIFCVWEDARVWAYWNHSFNEHLYHLGPVSCFHPEFPSACIVGGSCRNWGLGGGQLCLLKWQAAFLAHSQGE